MKRLQRAAALAAVILLVVLLFPTAVLAAPSNGVLRYGRSILSKMDNAAALQYVYDRLVEGCGETQSSINIKHDTYKVTVEEVMDLFKLLHSDYPEYFWISGSFGVTSSGSGVVSVAPEYIMTGSELASAKAAFAAKTDSLLAGLSGKSDYEKSLLLHDRLAQTVTYADTDNDQTAYGAMVEGKALCAGYAHAYQYLMQQAGMPAWVVTGTSYSPMTGNQESHAWNLVSVDGKWYYTDVTWDDQVEDVFYTYLNVTSAQINAEHTVTDFAKYLPTATATDANYFVRNKRTYASCDANTITAALKSGGNKTQFYITGDMNAFMAELKKQMSSIVKGLGAPAGSGYSFGMDSLGRAVILSVNIIPPGHAHDTTLVAKKAATCTAEGHSAYYTCDCGKWFSDAAAKKEITDKSTVVIRAVAHTPSGWKSDSLSHWKVCKQCGAEIVNSKADHADGDKNGKCDTCSMSLASKDTAGVGGGKTDAQKTTTGGNAAGKTTGTVAESTTSGVADTDGTTQAADVTSPTGDAAVSPEEPLVSGEEDEADPTVSSDATDTAHGNGGTGPITWVLISAGAATVVAGAGAGVGIVIKKRRGPF